MNEETPRQAREYDYEDIGRNSLGFSWSPCDRCGSALGGSRHEWHFRERGGNSDDGLICSDCLYAIAYGHGRRDSRR